MERPVISTTEGKIQGTTLTSVLGQKYLAFKGIPYAQPPVGPLRFKDPQKPLKWSGIRDGSKHGGDVSVQYWTEGPKPYKIIGSEDCLYLNVYTKPVGHKKPVMFLIHGGAFVEDNGNDTIYREDYLVSLDIVLVKINYRLGALGFFSLGCETASGNQGLKDMICALEWVQRNIEAFGGDPRNVTIFGNSAGSSASHLLTLVPMAKGLFHKAILQSGSIFFLKSLLEENSYVNGFRIAELLGKMSNDPEEVINYLRTVPAKKFVELEDQVLTKEEREILRMKEFGPVFDKNYTKNPLIPDSFSKLVKNDADIPIMLGHTPDECLLNFKGNFNDETYEFFDKNLDKILKSMVLKMEPNKYAEFVKDVRQFYLKNKPINKETTMNLVHMQSDILISHLNRKMVDLRNEHANAPTYLYRYSYLGNEPTIYSSEKDPQPLKGVAHADELSYLFYLTYLKADKPNEYPREGTTDELIMQRLLRMWYNFAATGNPTPVTDDRYLTTIWKPTTKENIYYLDINAKLTLSDDKDLESRSFYEKYKEYFA